MQESFGARDSKIRVYVVVAAAIALLAFLAAIGYILFLKGDNSAQKEDVVVAPAIVGRDLAKAKTTVKSLGLKIEIDQWVQSKVYPVNYVVTQKPLPGKKVKAGDKIVIKVSAGNKYSAGNEATKQPAVTSEDIRPLPTPPVNPRATLNGKIVVIDPGHQSRGDLKGEPIGPGSSQKKPRATGGTTGVGSRTPEYKVTLAISEKLKAKLESRGVKVIMTREKHEVNISNIERAQIANDNHADLFVRIHADGSGDRSENGISTLYPASNEWTAPIYHNSLKAARIIQETMVKATGRKDNGIVPRDDITGFNWSKVPSILAETGFLTNPKEDSLLNDPQHQDVLVQGIADGIIKYLTNE